MKLVNVTRRDGAIVAIVPSRIIRITSYDGRELSEGDFYEVSAATDLEDVAARYAVVTESVNINEAAKALGKRGGKKKTKKKARAAQINGKLGGHPKEN